MILNIYLPTEIKFSVGILDRLHRILNFQLEFIQIINKIFLLGTNVSKLSLFFQQN